MDLVVLDCIARYGILVVIAAVFIVEKLRSDKFIRQELLNVIDRQAVSLDIQMKNVESIGDILTDVCRDMTNISQKLDFIMDMLEKREGR